LGVTAWQRPKEMLGAPELLPGGAEGSPGKHLLSHGDDLLASQDSEETHQGDDRRRRGPDVEEAVKHADQQANAKCHRVSFHWHSSLVTRIEGSGRQNARSPVSDSMDLGDIAARELYQDRSAVI
jgi:hypothetical protein